MRPIDADKFTVNDDGICEDCDLIDVCDQSMCGSCSSKSFKELIGRQPTVDAVQVTRCKNCKHRPYKGQWGIEGDATCPCICDDSYYNYIPDDDWFCKNGKRKEVSK